MDTILKKRNDLGLLLIRLMLGGLMLFHGVAKVQGGPGHVEHMLIGAGLPGFLAYGVYILEIIAPICLIIGWKTRIWGLIYFFGMIVIMYVTNGSDLFALTKTGALQIETALFYAISGLALFFMGAGKYAISKNSQFD